MWSIINQVAEHSELYWSNYDILGIGDFVNWEISVWEAKAANIFVHFMNTFASLFVEVVVWRNNIYLLCIRHGHGVRYIYIYTDSQSDLYPGLRINLLTFSHSHSNPIQCNPFFATLQHNLYTTLFVPLWYWKILQTGFFSKSVYTEEDDVIILRMPVSDTESEYLEKFQVIKRWTGSK